MKTATNFYNETYVNREFPAAHNYNDMIEFATNFASTQCAERDKEIETLKRASDIISGTNEKLEADCRKHEERIKELESAFTESYNEITNPTSLDYHGIVNKIQKIIKRTLNNLNK